MMQRNRIPKEVWKGHWNGNRHEEGWDMEMLVRKRSYIET